MFTDGIENQDFLESKEVSGPIHVITTKKTNNVPKLKRIADETKGNFILLNAELEPVDEQAINEVSEFVGISGIVTDEQGVLNNVNIFNKSKNIGTTSASDGTYQIKGENGDLLVFTFLGKRTVNIRVGASDYINVNMVSINQELKEIVVEGEIESEELVSVGNSTVDKKKIGYAVETISKDDVSNLDTDLTNAVQGQFSNLTLPNDVYNKSDISKFLGRGKNMSIALSQYGVVVIDGVALSQSESNFGGIAYDQDNVINPDMIESITYLKGLAATNKYGTLGRNGVLIITTKAFAKNPVTNQKTKPLGTTETYTQNVNSIEALPNTDYMQLLKKANSIDEAYDIYLDQRTINFWNAEYYIDSYDYFKGWNNEFLSNRILSNIKELFYDNVPVLRALAFKQIENNNLNDAVRTYERILKMKPNQARSYRDLANALVLNKQYQDALMIYDKIEKKRGVGMANFYGIETTVTNEFKNLVNQHRQNLNTSGINPSMLKPKKMKKRIVFEWNDPSAEFDIQIVNPQKRYFTWSHTKAESAVRIAEERQQGFGSEEFFITNSDIGEWLFNVKYYGTDSKNVPTYIMITTYTDFGYPNEKREAKVIRLAEKKKLKTAVKLSI